MGGHDFEGLTETMACLTSTLDTRDYDRSDMGAGDDIGIEDNYPADLDRSGGVCDVPPSSSWPRVFNRLGLGFFRAKLVEHFYIMWKKGGVKWPSRKSQLRHLYH